MTNAEARCNKSLRPRKPEGSLGRTAQDVHLDSHTAPELCTETFRSFCFCLMSSDAKPGRHCLLYRTARQRPTGEKGWGNSGPVTRASLHSSPATHHWNQHSIPDPVISHITSVYNAYSFVTERVNTSTVFVHVSARVIGTGQTEKYLP